MSVKKIMSQVGLYLTILIIVFIVLGPIYWLVITSIKLPKEWVIYPPKFIASQVYWKTYVDILTDREVQRSIFNTTFVTVIGTSLSLIIASMASYSLSKIQLGFNRPLIVWIVMNRLIPPVTLVIPFFLIMRSLRIIDTLLALILTRIVLTFPFIVWIMLGFFRQIPEEIDDAAKIDGCDFIGRFIWTGIPLGAVGLATAGIFVFVFSWKELLFSITVAVENAKTLPVFIAGFVDENSFNWGPMTVLSVISTVPILVFALSIQRYFVRGLTLGAVKE